MFYIRNGKLLTLEVSNGCVLRLWFFEVILRIKNLFESVTTLLDRQKEQLPIDLTITSRY